MAVGIRIHLIDCCSLSQLIFRMSGRVSERKSKLKNKTGRQKKKLIREKVHQRNNKSGKSQSKKESVRKGVYQRKKLSRNRVKQKSRRRKNSSKKELVQAWSGKSQLVAVVCRVDGCRGKILRRLTGKCLTGLLRAECICSGELPLLANSKWCRFSWWSRMHRAPHASLAGLNTTMRNHFFRQGGLQLGFQECFNHVSRHNVLDACISHFPGLSLGVQAGPSHFEFGRRARYCLTPT